jgi:hypothetical protein
MSAPKITWKPAYLGSIDGCLSETDGVNIYSIRPMLSGYYRLFGMDNRKFNNLGDFSDLEEAKKYAEQLEVNK